VKKKIKVFILERQDKGVRKASNFGSNFTHSLIIENESQTPQFIGERAEYFGAKI